jgi:hypothetical protein
VDLPEPLDLLPGPGPEDRQVQAGRALRRRLEPQARMMEAALDITVLRSRLRILAASLPRSPEEDAMLEGRVPLDEPTEMRLTLNAVVEDQLDQALGNLLSPSPRLRFRLFR